MLGRRIAARPRPPATVRDLEIALLEEWNSIPQNLIDKLIASMANRILLKLGRRTWCLSPTNEFSLPLAAELASSSALHVCFGVEKENLKSDFRCSGAGLGKYDQQKNELATASSGIAVTLLNGGAKAHSAFQLVLDIHEKPNAMGNI
ncbi:hypothetical protein TNCV_948341 [Trichonephila clavipes]|nr:hypothetical protein TNCV_948341 [Trichonephila clavipes]